MEQTLQISLLGELRVISSGKELPLPASRKTRALLAFLVSTGRPHRRERLCELFWDLPDDPKAALRWSLSKLRKVVDTPMQQRIIADRERVQFDATGIDVDIRNLHTELRDSIDVLSIEQLEQMAYLLESVPLDGLDGAGVERFDAWLLAERQDAQLLRGEVLAKLATQPHMGPIAADKWFRMWRQVDPSAADHYEQCSFSSMNHMERISANDSSFVQPAFEQNRPMALRQPCTKAEFRTSAPETKTNTTQALRTQKIRFCEVPDGTKIAYATIGSGAPLVKAANWLSHLEFDWDSPIWGKSFAEIARYRTFVRYDERGCGLSDWSVKDLSFNAFVEDLEVVADTLDAERFPLLGISQGSAVAIEYAVRHPERVSALILFGGYAAGWRHHASTEEQALRETMMTLTELGWGTDNPAYRQVFSQTFMPEASTRDLDWFNEFQRLTTSPQNAARFQDAFGFIDVRNRLTEVKAPTIVLHSKYDQRIPIELGRALASGIPDAQFVPLESCNHILVDDEPAWKVCCQAVSQFMDDRGI